jgi:hypothetical protein
VMFLNAKMFCPAEIHKQIVEVYGEGSMWGNGVGCSKKAGLRCITRNEVEARPWSWMIWKKNWIQTFGKTGDSKLLNYTNFSSGQPESEEWTEDKRPCAVLAERLGGDVFPTKAFKSRSHDISALIYMATMWRSSWM